MKNDSQTQSPNSPKCPVCSSSARRYYDHPDADLYQCLSCTHVFTDQKTLLQEDYGPDYYEKTHRNWFANPNLSLFEEIRKIAVGHSAKCRVLDVGCGNGDLLKYLHSRHPEMTLVGVELSQLPDHPGIRYIKSDIFELNLEEKFDLVVNLAVIEHVTDIVEFVKRLSSFLSPDGTLVAMTLNGDSVLYRVSRLAKTLGWPDAFNRIYSNHHLHHYTRRSLKQLMETSGLKVISHKSHNFPLAAVDFPSKGVLSDKIQLVGVAGCFALGNLLDMGFLQTIVCSRTGI